MDRVEEAGEENNVEAGVGEQRLLGVEFGGAETRTELDDADHGDQNRQERVDDERTHREAQPIHPRFHAHNFQILLSNIHILH